MYQKELYVDGYTIDQEIMEKAESAALRHIRRSNERIGILRRLTVLNGRYITKRIDDELKAMFPEYRYVHVSKAGTYSTTLSIYFSNGECQSDICIDIADKETRRASLTKINNQIEREEKNIQAFAEAMKVFRENAAQWNNLISYAATIYGPLYTLLSKCGDYRAEHFCRL